MLCEWAGSMGVWEYGSWMEGVIEALKVDVDGDPRPVT
jgi:hypothetical protein